MANSTVYLGTTQSGAPVPIRAVDQGDGSYALATTTTNGPGVLLYLGTTQAGQPLPIKAVDNGDGTYSILVA